MDILKNSFSYRFFFIIVCLFTCVIMLFASQYYGITWDEWIESRGGAQALLSLISPHNDRGYNDVFYPGHSGLFYMTVTALYGLLHGDLFAFLNMDDSQLLEFFNFSHFINAIFGFIGMLFTGLLAKQLGSWRTAFLALLFMVLSPRIFGGSMNNPKDIPLASMYIVALYFMSLFFSHLPCIKKKYALLTAISIGLCIGVRVGGLVLILYLLIIGLYKVFSQKKPTTIISILLTLIGICALGFSISLLFWPYGREHSLSGSINAVTELTQFKYWNFALLFEGKMLWPAEVPWYFISKWVLISSPLFLHAGLVMALFWLLTKSYKNDTAITITLLILSIVFPLSVVIITHSTVYNSWRHLFFIYPSLIVLAAMGWDYLLAQSATHLRRAVIMVCLCLTCLEPLTWMIRNPLYTSMYFNPLVGGLKGAFLNYESDYWGSCMRESAQWLGQYHRNTYGDKPAVIMINGELMRAYPFLRKELGAAYIPYGYPANQDFIKYFANQSFGFDYSKSWDYTILLAGGVSRETLLYHWPPPGTIFTAQADGIPLCVVVANTHLMP